MKKIKIARSDCLKIQWKKLILCLVLPLAVGGLSAFLTQDSMKMFETIQKPPLSPPGWLFPIVWTILYLFMGIASYLVLTSSKSSQTALTLYGIQLVFNFIWPLIFFNRQQYLFAFIWLVLLWLSILATIIPFDSISKPAKYFMLPYLLWVTFAGYLNFAIYLLN